MKASPTRILLCVAVLAQVLYLGVTPKPHLQAAAQLNKAKIRIYGQYTQFNQPNISWTEVCGKVAAVGYNGFSVHGMSPWGAYPTQMPWVYDSATRRYDLGRPNPRYRANVRKFLKECGGSRDLSIHLALFDFYYQTKTAYRTSLNPHPFRSNRQGIDWSTNVESLGQSKPWFTHVSWTTEGGGFRERVVVYQIQQRYRWLWNYINLWGQEIKRVRAAYPKMEPVLVRYINESHTRYRNGTAVQAEGGEDKIYQILTKEWAKRGLKHGRDYIIVDDWVPLEGVQLIEDEWLQSFNFTNQFGWYRELHNVHPQQYDKIKRINTWHRRTIYSTDSVKPENNTYISKARYLYCSDARLVDIKVPSELSQYKDKDFMFTFRKVLPIMRRISTCQN